MVATTTMVRIAFYIAIPVVLILLLVARPNKSDGDSAAQVAAPASVATAEAAAPDLSAMTTALVAAIPKDGSAEHLFAATCAACHGPAGQGNASLKAPSIAGLPAWFSQLQFEKFRNGQRGEGEGDAAGSHMQAIANAIDEQRLTGLAEHIEKMPIVATRNDLGGDAVAGEALFMEHCAGCHRYNAHGEKAFRSAPLSGLQDWYLLETLIKYREETRGYHRNDIDGIFMHRNLKYVTDEDFRHIIAYIAELAVKYPPDERRPRSRAADGSNAPIQ